MSDTNFPQALPTGTLLRGSANSYRIERVLGSGGFGITYLASTTLSVDGISVKAHFAIKEHFPKELCYREPDGMVYCHTNNSERVEATLKDFVTEARRLRKIAAATSNQNIVKVREVFEANGTAYYVMEYLEGPTIAQYVASHGAFDEAGALTIMQPILHAAEHLHANSITHLDIKPANIVLCSDGDSGMRPVLIDFGLAKHYDASGAATSTINTIGCSKGYAPLEQYAGLRKFSPQSDVYALSATLLFMLSGQTPPHAEDITPQHIAGMLYGTGVSAETVRAIQHGMAYSRADRTASATQLIRELGSVACEVKPDAFSETTSQANSFSYSNRNSEEYSDNISKPRPKPKPAPKPADKAIPRTSGWLITWSIILLISLPLPLMGFVHPIAAFAVMAIAAFCLSRRFEVPQACALPALLILALYSAIAIPIYYNKGTLFEDMTSVFGLLFCLPVYMIALYSLCRCFATEKPMHLFIPAMVIVLFVYIAASMHYRNSSTLTIIVIMAFYTFMTYIVDRNAGAATRESVILFGAVVGILTCFAW